MGAVLACEPDLLLLTDGLERTMATIPAVSAAGVVVVVVTATEDDLMHARCLAAGAAGVVEKSAPIERLIDAVLRGLAGEEFMSQQRRHELSQALVSSPHEPATSPFESLTPRESATLQALMLGHSAGRIARDHGVSLVTVRTHIRAVLLKLDVHSQLEAVTKAAREGWTGPDGTLNPGPP